MTGGFLLIFDTHRRRRVKALIKRIKESLNFGHADLRQTDWLSILMHSPSDILDDQGRFRRADFSYQCQINDVKCSRQVLHSSSIIKENPSSKREREFVTTTKSWEAAVTLVFRDDARAENSCGLRRARSRIGEVKNYTAVHSSNHLQPSRDYR